MPNSQPRPVRRNAVQVGPFPTADSIAQARAAQLRERAEVIAQTGLVIDDDGRLGLLIGNAIAFVCDGPRGKYRPKR